jgi:hypothetical protein
VTRLAPLVALLALAAAGCGGGGASVASQTGTNVAKIKSGVLDLRLVVDPHGGGEPFGFELRGPFALREGKLPVARLALTQIANGSSATATLVSDGRRAWIVSSGVTRALSSSQASGLSFTGGFQGLDIGSWIRDPKVTDAGNGLDRVTGRLDVVAAANGLNGIAALTGRTVPKLAGDDATRLEEATRSSSVVLLTGKDDRLLRSLNVAADLGFDVPASLRQALGTRVGAKIEFRLAVARPNSRVVVHAP